MSRTISSRFLAAGLLLLAPAPSNGTVIGAALQSASASAQGQATSKNGGDNGPLASAGPKAAAAWRRLLSAGKPRAVDSPPAAVAALPPPHAFHLRAKVITRDGANTNEVEVDYSFLSPNFVRFLLPSNRQTGHGSGKGLSAFWLKDGDDVQRLDTRDNKEDRRVVKKMIALAHNFLALTDPERIRLTRLEFLEEAPLKLPTSLKRRIARELRRTQEASERAAAKQPLKGDPGEHESLLESAAVATARPTLAWIRITSPDFDIALGDSDVHALGHDQLVSLAIGPTGLPLLALVQEPGAERRPLDADAVLIHLGRWVLKADEDLRIPYRILIWRPEQALAPDGSGIWIFARDPVQDIALSKADLRPDFVPTDFDP